MKRRFNRIIRVIDTLFIIFLLVFFGPFMFLGSFMVYIFPNENPDVTRYIKEIGGPIGFLKDYYLTLWDILRRIWNEED
jgi:hypothetical protein